VKRPSLSLAGLLLASRAIAAPVGATAVIDRPLVKLDGEIIWKSVADERVKRSMGQLDLRTVIEELVEEKLFLMRAAELKLTVEDSEIDEALKDIKSENKLDDKQLDEALKQQGYTRQTYRVDLRDQILVLRAANLDLGSKVNVGDAEIAKVAADRKLKTPLSDADRTAIRRELYGLAMHKARAEWVAERRKSIRIEIRADK